MMWCPVHTTKENFANCASAEENSTRMQNVLYPYEDVRRIYSKIWPEPEVFPEGAARGKFRGLRPDFTVYPDSNPNTDNISFLTRTY